MSAFGIPQTPASRLKAQADRDRIDAAIVAGRVQRQAEWEAKFGAVAAITEQVNEARAALDRLIGERDDRIREALAGGAAYGPLGEVTGLSRAMLDSIRRNARGAAPITTTAVTSDGTYTGRTLASIVRREYGRNAVVRFSADPGDPYAGVVAVWSEKGSAWNVLATLRSWEGVEGS